MQNGKSPLKFNQSSRNIPQLEKNITDFIEVKPIQQSV